MEGPSKTHGKRIFLVDDHPMVRDRLAQLVEQQSDLTVCGEADNVTDALNGICASLPDIAIVDLSLKNSNGLELIKDIKARGLQTPVLVLSMHDENLYAERALRAGALGYVNKQETSQVILHAIRRVIDGQIHVSPEISAILMKRALGRSEATDHSPASRLGDRELEVFQLIGRGLGTRKIAETLGISIKTVETYRARIKEKLGIADAVQLLRAAMQWVQKYDSDAPE
ncbi:MAG: response regulator transcription factor [Verrucomicrobiota bacterium]